MPGLPGPQWTDAPPGVGGGTKKPFVGGVAVIVAAIGSNNMLLYLAGLSNISPELYEASSMDGAVRWRRR